MVEQEKYIEELANHDYITNLPNRMFFMKELEGCVKKNKNCGVALLDLDDFKMINDTRGHVYGDELLKEVAGQMRDNLPQETVLARFGGDEFILLFCDVSKGNCRQIECWERCSKVRFCSGAA
jgi:diguanylate cyclase (GGDEF)-like protein